MIFWAGLVSLLAVANARTITMSIREPPNPYKVALMARFIVNEANYTSIGTISSQKLTSNQPFVSLLSLGDGPVGKGSGIPYMFITPLAFAGRDLEKNDSASLMMSLAQNGWCAYKNYDPMDPRCARVTFTGRVKKIEKESPEYATAKSAIYGRHPWLSGMPESHHFYFAKLEIETIVVLDKFGGPAFVTPKDYYNADERALDEYARLYK